MDSHALPRSRRAGLKRRHDATLVQSDRHDAHASAAHAPPSQADASDSQAQLTTHNKQKPRKKRVAYLCRSWDNGRGCRQIFGSLRQESKHSVHGGCQYASSAITIPRAYRNNDRDGPLPMEIDGGSQSGGDRHHHDIDGKDEAKFESASVDDIDPGGFEYDGADGDAHPHPDSDPDWIPAQPAGPAESDPPVPAEDESDRESDSDDPNAIVEPDIDIRQEMDRDGPNNRQQIESDMNRITHAHIGTWNPDSSLLTLALHCSLFLSLAALRLMIVTTFSFLV